MSGPKGEETAVVKFKETFTFGKDTDMKPLLSLGLLISTPGTVLDTDLFWTWAPLDNKLFLRLCLRIKMCRCFISISCPVSCARTGPVLTCASEAAAHLKKSGPALPLSPRDRQRAPHSMETMFSNPQRERNFFFFQERKLSLREIK